MEIHVDYDKSLAERRKEYYRTWKQNNKEKVLEYKAVRRERNKRGKDAVDRLLSRAYRLAIATDPCLYCGRTTEEMNIDHFFPVAKGGLDVWLNLFRACSECNKSKSNRCGTWYHLRKGNFVHE